MFTKTLIKMNFFRMEYLLIFVLYKSLLNIKDTVVILKIEELLNLSVLLNSVLI